MKLRLYSFARLFAWRCLPRLGAGGRGPICGKSGVDSEKGFLIPFHGSEDGKGNNDAQGMDKE